MMDCHMAKETREQPGLVRRMVPTWARSSEKALAVLEARRQLAVVGRGSSGNACTFATYLYAMHHGRHPIEFRPWICTQPSAREVRWDDAGVFAYSSSGQSTDVAQTALWLKERGAAVVGVTNGPADSNLARASDALVSLDAGEERAVPATKSFTAQLFATAALCGFPIEPVAEPIAASMDSILASDAASRIADFITGGRVVAWVARGPALAAARDAALKVQEAVGMVSSAWSAAELLHGPIGALSRLDRIVLMQDTPAPAESLDAVSVNLLARGAPHLMVADTETSAAGDRPHAHFDLSVRVPLPQPRWARTIVFAFLSQVVTLELAERAGINPDHPRGLNKVTLTQ